MDNSDFRNDPQHRADYEQARLLLNQPPHLWFDSEAVTDRLTHPAVRYQPHEFSEDRLADVEARICIRRTPNPLIREVLYQGRLRGRIAKNPYGIGWLASCDRKVMYFSQRDAALRVVMGDFDE